MKLIIFYFLSVLSVACANELPCNCRLGNSNRIVNGEIATANFMPWMVSLANIFGSHFCGATIINEKYVLTASHCTKNINPIYTQIRVGLHNLDEVDDENIYRGVKVISKPFRKPGDFGDFSLIELAKPIKFVPGKIEPACLNLVDEKFEGNFISAGWGLTSRPWRKITGFYNSLNVTPQNTNDLKYYFSTQTYDDCEDHDICVIAKKKGDSACHGDSGGPLMHTKNGKTSIVGIASFVTSTRKGNKRIFCVGHVSYARLALYKNLIDRHAGNYCKA